MDKPIISKELMESLLGRPLSQVETDNFNLYLNITVMRLDDLLCAKLENLTDIPVDLQLLIARAFGVVTAEQAATASHGINKKQVEDFSISYESDADNPMVAFAKQNEATINKYSECTVTIRSGKVENECAMFRCI